MRAATEEDEKAERSSEAGGQTPKPCRPHVLPQQATLDQLMLSLRLDAIYVKENFKINWACETGLVENIDQIIREYKKERGLLPIKACILGPPASGKSVIVKQLCDHYKLHHIRAKDVITEAIANLQRSAARADAEEEDDDGKAAEDAETLEQVNENMAENNGRLDDNFVIRFFREKLASKPCQNQGFIIDGFPKTKQQAEDLFARKRAKSIVHCAL